MRHDPTRPLVQADLDQLDRPIHLDADDFDQTERVDWAALAIIVIVVGLAVFL